MPNAEDPESGITGSHNDNVRCSSVSTTNRNSAQGPRGRQDTKFQSSSSTAPKSSSTSKTAASDGKKSKSKKSSRRSDGKEDRNKFRATTSSGKSRPQSQPHNQQQQQEAEDDEDDDNYTMDSDDFPGAMHVEGNGHRALSGRSLLTSANQNNIDNNIEEGEMGNESNLPLALPAEVVEARETIIATIADDYIENQNKRDDDMATRSGSQVTLSVRTLLLIACIVIVIAVAVSVGVGVVLANRDNNGMLSDDELIPPASSSGNTQQDDASNSNTETSDLTSTPTASANHPQNPQVTIPPKFDSPTTSPPTPTPISPPTVALPPNDPLVEEFGQLLLCSCWYYTQDIFLSSPDDHKELTDTQQGYFEQVYKGLLNMYEPTNGEFVQLGITTTKVLIESQSLFGKFNTNSARFGISLAYQLEYCAPSGVSSSSGGEVTEDLLFSFHEEYNTYMFEKVHRDSVVSSLQQEVGLSSATGISTANRLDLTC